MQLFFIYVRKVLTYYCLRKLNKKEIPVNAMHSNAIIFYCEIIIK